MTGQQQPIFRQAECGAHFLEPPLIQIAQREAGPGAREDLRGGKADTAGCTAHQQHPALE